MISQAAFVVVGRNTHAFRRHTFDKRHFPTYIFQRDGERASRPEDERRTVSSVVESGSVGITVRNSEPRSFEGSPERYYVKVVADEESLGETATHLPAYSRVPSLSSHSTFIYTT